MVDDSLQPTDTRVKQLEKKTKLTGFLQTHCRKKALYVLHQKVKVFKAPKLPADIFSTLKHIPDPMPEGEVL